MSGQPYSDRALYAACNATEHSLGSDHPPHHPALTALAAAHDREALGLDASVCARTHLLEVVSALRQQLYAYALHDDTDDPHDEGYTAAQDEMHSWLDVLAREAAS